jgi:D-glycero-D-manno-heptose 1,7-bisphosphate phosphatase
VSHRAVFLDRDGVLNRTTVENGVPHPPATAAQVELLPGVPDALALLATRGLLRIVVTNQPDVARGAQTREAVEGINQRLLRELPLDAVYTCYHDDPDQCECRKPRGGLIEQASQAFDIDPRASFMVGDRWSDIAAGQAAGCTTFLLDAPYSQSHRCTPDYNVADLLQAARQIVGLLQSTGDRR